MVFDVEAKGYAPVPVDTSDPDGGVFLVIPRGSLVQSISVDT